MLMHLSAIAGYFLAPPIGNILGPLIMWLIKKDEMPFLDQQGKEALNFQISTTIYMLVSSLLCFVGIPLVLVVMIVGLVFTVIAGVKANEGIAYTYPLSIRFIR